MFYIYDMENDYILDFADFNNQLLKIDENFNLLNDRFNNLHNAYIHQLNINDLNFIDDSFNIRKYKDNVLFRLKSVRFHFNLFMMCQGTFEDNMKNISLSDNPLLYMNYEKMGTEELYSLFDSMVYHICSIFDYLFSLINFIHGKEKLDKPKWNNFRTDKNKKKHLYCSAEMIEALTKIDDNFVFPLIQYRSHLIHTKHEVGILHFIDQHNKSKFLVTETFKNHFPEFSKEIGNQTTTLAYAAKWLLDASFKNITEILFEIRDDIYRNKEITNKFFLTLKKNSNLETVLQKIWGERNAF